MQKANIKIDRKAIDSYLESLRKDPRLKNYLIDEHNANLYEQMINSMSHCDKCKSLSECPNNIKGYKKVVENNSLKMCACKYLKSSIELENANLKFKTLFLPENVINATLDNYYLTSESRKKAYQDATNFISNIDSNPRGLYLYGEFGVGKTFLLAAIANELTKKGKNVILAYFPDLVRSIKNAFETPAKLEEIINELKTVDVLMLDDVGSENLTPWLRDEILGPILNYRYMAHNTLCVSSNLSPQQYISHLSHTSQGDDTVKGTRIALRLLKLADKTIQVKD